MDLKQEIIGLINGIESENLLTFIRNLIISFKKEWGL